MFPFGSLVVFSVSRVREQQRQPSSEVWREKNVDVDNDDDDYYDYDDDDEDDHDDDDDDSDNDNKSWVTTNTFIQTDEGLAKPKLEPKRRPI